MAASSSQRRPTIADVAALAGVSQATVSRVMNGNKVVDPALSERVLGAARQLNYAASPFARGLVLGRTYTIAVIVSNLASPTFQGVFRGLGQAAMKSGYRLQLVDAALSISDERVLAQETRRSCDGIVLVAPRMDEAELAELLTELHPAVIVNREPAVGSDIPSVTADYRIGLVGLLELLYADGHRSLLYLAGAPESVSNSRRLAALEDFALAHRDLSVQVRPCGVDFSEGYDVARAVAASGATGVLAFNDAVAMGVICALTEQGVRVPDQVSVVGFGDVPFARYVTPPLTTAAVPLAEIGTEVWRRMQDLLGGRTPDRSLVLKPAVVRRGSTGAAPDRSTAPKSV